MVERYRRQVVGRLGWLALLLGVWLSCATARAQTQETLPGVAGLLTRGHWSLNLEFDWERDRRLLISAIGSAGVPVAAAETPRLELWRFLGGQLRELTCKRVGGQVHCRMSILWRVFDSASGTSLYETTTRVTLYGVETSSKAQLRDALLRHSVASLAKREHFRTIMHASGQITSPPPPTASFKACDAPGLKMPVQAPDAVSASVMLEVGRGVGSGFFLNEEGLVLTAAHVVIAPKLKVRLASGKSYDASVVRLNRAADMALLRVDGLTETPCLRLAEHEPAIGADLYAIGAPGGQSHSFSLTRGIMSGVRSVRGYARVQTDTPVSPGNSGGPLLGTDGRVEAVVQTKMVHEGVEGVAFGMPCQAALTALGLKPGAATDAALHEVLATLPATQLVKDPSDPALPIDASPPVTALSEPTSPLAPIPDQRAQTAGYVKGLRWGGLGAAVVGLTIAMASNASYHPGSASTADYERLRTWNDIGWVMAGVGAGCFTLSFVLGPAKAPMQVSAKGSAGGLSIGLEGAL
jgi:S1-C subfamily serine protease